MIKPTHNLLLAAVALAMTGCAAIPDQQLAREAYLAGDLQTAERHYRQLADMGFVDASLGLADIQQQSSDPAQLAAAERTYRQAADQSPRARARLGKLLASKPGATRAEQLEAEQLLQSAMQSGETGILLPLTQLYLQYPQTWPNLDPQHRINEWRQQGQAEAELAQVLLYRAQGSYAQHLDEVERVCRANLALYDSCYVELATVNQLRADTKAQEALIEQLKRGIAPGQASSQRLESVARVITDPALGTPNPELAQQLLLDVAQEQPAAWITLARLANRYPGIADGETILDYLERGHKAAPAQADLLTGRLYYEGKWVPQDAAKAETHLLRATSEPDAHYLLGQMYRRGHLGRVQPQKAVDHLLVAARAGNPSADLALAQLYAQGKGVRKVPENAFVFARLAQMSGNVKAAETLTQLAPQLTGAKQQQAQQLLQRELQARGAMWQANAQARALGATTEMSDMSEMTDTSETQESL